ncbi:MAG: histidine phosphatase family protein, partial [Pyrinomonadaceae bacterium]|nr:histidine phosphatase family protein [Pyrinomonadaceae bacterium]
MTTTQIFLIRHGEPIETARGRCYGKLDVTLSERGKSQICETNKFLHETKLAAVYSSPRVRAVDSAKIIASAQNLQTDIDDGFAEIDFGDFEGLTYEEVEKRFPETFKIWMKTPTKTQFPNGESFSTMQERVLSGFYKLKARHVNQDFAIVSHGGVNRIILANALKMADEDIFRLGQDYACLNKISFYDDFPLVQK